jgi:hypothetical protein
VKHILKRAPDSGSVLLRQTCKKLCAGIAPLPHINNQLCTVAAREGYLNLVEWAKNKGYTWKKDDVCKTACVNGHLKIVFLALADRAQFSNEWIDYAVMNGHLNILEWAKSRLYTSSLKIQLFLAAKGDLNTLKKVVENRHNTPSDFMATAFAAEEKNQHLILAWLKEKKFIK